MTVEVRIFFIIDNYKMDKVDLEIKIGVSMIAFFCFTNTFFSYFFSYYIIKTFFIEQLNIFSFAKVINF